VRAAWLIGYEWMPTSIPVFAALTSALCYQLLCRMTDWTRKEGEACVP
jgi:hypothetical protein